MFLEYYGLLEQPFSAACTSRRVYASHTHCEVLDSFKRSLLEDRGNLALIAPSGTGKTTLLCELLEHLRQSGRRTHLFQKQCAPSDILRFLLSELGTDSSGMDLAAMRGKLNGIWFAEMLAGRRFVLLFDDAEDLDDAVLETLRLLLKFETSNTKLLQIILCGQPQLLNRLKQDGLIQLRKCIVEVKRLEALSPMETAGYMRQKLEAAGHHGHSLFDPDAIAAVAELSHGIPGNINKICSRALMEAYARGLRAVSAEIVEKANRNLRTLAAVARRPLPSTRPIATSANDAAVLRLTSRLTYKTPPPFGLPGSGVWMSAVLGVLLSAGLALPQGMFKGVTQIMRPEPAAAGQPPREPASQLPSQPDRAVMEVAAQPAISSPRTLNVDTTKRALADMLPEFRGTQDGRLSLTRELGLKINRIVIDPGHGGFDTGAKGPHGLQEKDLCLDVALRLGKMIEDNIAGAQVVYTRKDDSYVPLEERTALANDADADLFISIHANSSDISEVRGVETYYLSLAASKEAKELAIRENAMTQSSLHDLPDLVKKITRNEKIAESKLLAAEIQDALSERLQIVSRREKNRGVKQAPFIVLTGANMPAVLSEISFVSNANDESLLLEGAQRQRIADGLYRGIAAYLDGLHGMPPNRPKLLTENRGGPLPTFPQTMAGNGRNPL